MLNCVDLFAGAGGLSLAAKRAGLRVRLAVDNDLRALDTYKTNLCPDLESPVVLEGDISGMNAADAFRLAFPDGDQCDLLLGGPPCQGFSTHRINGAGVGDTRNDLIHVYFDFVRAFAPSIFLMENVPGMLWERHSAGLLHFYKEASAAGYDLQNSIVVDARNYGIPQRRKRVFILGLRNGLRLDGLSWPPPATHGGDVARRDNAALEPWNSCADAFRNAPTGDPNDVHMSHGKELIAAFERTPANGGSRSQSGRILECHKNHDGHKDVYGRIDPSKPGPTMTTACINPSKGRFVHPVEHHGITVRQAARMQTFPDEFIFQGGLIAAGKQVGNAVPVELGRQLLVHLMPLLHRGRVVDELRAA